MHLVGILFPHINDDARSKSHQTITHITKTPTQLSKRTHITKPTHTPTPQSYQYSVTSSREPQIHNSDTVNKFHLTCIEDENN